MSLPPLFVSHGSPMLILQDIPARQFLAGLAGLVGRPKAILAVSAHWETEAPSVSTAARPETIHDFYGFPDELYKLRYDAPGAPDMARRAVSLLGAAGIAAATDPGRGLDHGAWAPLKLAWPAADIPVTQLSIQPHLGPLHHFKVGQALAPLRAEGVLILASGSATHNLRRLRMGAGQQTEAWAEQFDAWLQRTVESGDSDALVDYEKAAPFAHEAHPRDEHFLPIMVAAGAAGAGIKARALHRSFTAGNLSMAAYAFG